jgi:UDP-N-acetylmuramoyl-L-alanyl-D-glutamate--2,6-diaminopimelate ligase
VTSDNPRTEDPDAIIDEIVTEMTPGSFERIADRRVAIAAALDMASADDIVLLAGKGHEDYQIIGTTKHPFDERVVVADLLTARREGGR